MREFLLLRDSLRYQEIVLMSYFIRSFDVKTPGTLININYLITFSDKLVTLRSSSSASLRHPRIIDSQDISSDSHRFIEDSKAVNPDEVR